MDGRIKHIVYVSYLGWCIKTPYPVSMVTYNKKERDFRENRVMCAQLTLIGTERSIT